MGLLGRVKQCEEERNGNKNLQEKKEKKWMRTILGIPKETQVDNGVKPKSNDISIINSIVPRLINQHYI